MKKLRIDSCKSTFLENIYKWLTFSDLKKKKGIYEVSVDFHATGLIDNI